VAVAVPKGWETLGPPDASFYVSVCGLSKGNAFHFTISRSSLVLKPSTAIVNSSHLDGSATVDGRSLEVAPVELPRWKLG
jgi:hypothetical protein